MKKALIALMIAIAPMTAMAASSHDKDLDASPDLNLLAQILRMESEMAPPESQVLLDAILVYNLATAVGDAQPSVAAVTTHSLSAVPLPAPLLMFISLLSVSYLLHRRGARKIG